MLKNSGVFGMIPYKLFYTTEPTISNITAVFEGCYKLGYTNNRTIRVGVDYDLNGVSLKTNWTDCVIGVPGTRVPFQLDFTSFDGSDEWYIDGRDWKEINPDLENAIGYNDTIFSYDRLQKQALSDSRDREVGY
jgi:hypothetical protein